MIKELTRLLAGIDPGTSFTAHDLIARIKTELDKVLNGGVERSEFERQLFAFGNLSDLPIGHLFDHRVRMPDDLARDVLTKRDPGVLQELLLNMLCSPHSEGAVLVAEALGRAPGADALLLLEMHPIYPDFVRVCLRGAHGDAMALLADAPTGDWPKLQALLIATAIYYGALQLQLIALRQKAIDEFRFAVDNGQMTHTMGSLIEDLRQLIKELKKARDWVLFDKKPLGKRADVVNLLTPMAIDVQSKAYCERPGLTEEGLLEKLRELFHFMAPTIDAWDVLLPEKTGEEREDAKPIGAEDPAINKSTQGDLRELITTAVGGGVSGGEQIAFASLRLHGFAKRLPAIIADGLPTRRNGWFGCLAGFRNPDIGRLVLVNRSAVWAKSQNPAAYAPDGSPHDLRSILAQWAGLQNKSTPNQELVRATKKRASEWKGTGSPVPLGHGLTGCQLWDIHPEFHFDQLVGPWIPKRSPRRKRKPPGDEAHLHRPSPLRYAEKASHRPC